MKREEFLRKCDEVQKYWHGGKRTMPMMVMEEAGELIQAISKYERFMGDPIAKGCLLKESLREVEQNLINEIGDMYISLMALQLYYGNEGFQDIDPYKPIEELIELRIEKKLNKKY